MHCEDCKYYSHNRCFLRPDMDGRVEASDCGCGDYERWETELDHEEEERSAETAQLRQQLADVELWRDRWAEVAQRESRDRLAAQQQLAEKEQEIQAWDRRLGTVWKDLEAAQQRIEELEHELAKRPNFNSHDVDRFYRDEEGKDE